MILSVIKVTEVSVKAAAALLKIRIFPTYLVWLMPYDVNHCDMKLMKKSYFYSAALLALLLNGCASQTKLESIPITNEEFAAPLTSLKTTYADIPRYEPIWMNWGKFWSSEQYAPRPSLTELNSKWGKAKTEKKNWFEWMRGSALMAAVSAANGSWAIYAIVQLTLIKPSETHTWEIGDKQIKAHIYGNGFNAYEDRLGYWEWEQSDKQVLTMGAAE